MQGQAGACSALFKGVYAVAWGLPPDEPPTPGLTWRWTGEALRLDGGAPALWLARPLARTDVRPRARARLRRLAIAPHSDAAPTPSVEPPPGGLTLTDGRQLYPARLVPAQGGAVLVFDPWLPPPDTDLWVAAADARPVPERPAATGGLVAGTLVETDLGPRPVESLAPGDRLLTRDHGPQTLIWRGETRLSGAELILHPHLRPLRLRSGLRLAPGQRLAVPAPPGLGLGTEALATAADLEDGRAIRRDLACGSVGYVHLLLARHALLEVAGTTLDSFHPALADPATLRWHSRALERAAPGLGRDPWRHGPTALPCLDTAATALRAAA
jgi:hypothetical protein